MSFFSELQTQRKFYFLVNSIRISLQTTKVIQGDNGNQIKWTIDHMQLSSQDKNELT